MSEDSDSVRASPNRPRDLAAHSIIVASHSDAAGYFLMLAQTVGPNDAGTSRAPPHYGERKPRPKHPWRRVRDRPQ